MTLGSIAAEMVLAAKFSLKLRIESIFSLKEKRSIVQRIKSFVSKKENVCIVESAFQDNLNYIGFTVGFLSFSKDQAVEKAKVISCLIERETDGIIEKEELELM